MSSSIRLGEPVQIVNFKLLPSQPSRLVLQKKLLSQILKEVGNTPICLISIAGASRQGKSFLLTVVLNALECLSRGQTDYWEDLDRLNGLSGFHFKNGTERDTVGLWLWSKPFIITKSDNTKIAVMLMDTQGVFDSYTTERDWAMIVGLSLLTSSCLIYNLFNNMQEDTLKIFHNFVEFGMLSLEEDSTATSAFQKLVFLIRDWNFPNTHSYGPLGGSNFLEKKLAVTPDMPPEVTKVRKTLVTCFEEIFCFLMPNPGEAAKDNNFSGALGLLNEAFRDNLRLFVDNLISYDDLKPIKIGNNIIDGTSLISYFEKYVEVFNGKTIPQPKSLYQAMEEARLGSCITKCCNQAKEKLEKVQKSCKYIPNNEFKQYCDKFGKEALTEFMAEGNKTKNQEFVQRHRAILLSDLKTLFGDIFATNETSNKSILNKILDVSLAQFKSILAEKTRQTLLEQDLEDILETEAKKIMLKVRQDCEGWDAAFQKEGETKIKELIDTENTAIRGQNSTKFKELEHLCQTSLQTCTQEYNSLMNLALCNDVKNVTEEKLSQTHKKCESIVLPKFMGSLANESEIIQGHFRHQFNTGINQILEQYAEKFSTARNEASSAAKNIYDESYTAYITAMTALAESGTASESDLKTEHRFKVLEACQTLNQIQIICSSEEAKEFENKMRQETTQFCDELIASIHNDKERFQSLLDQAVKNAVETYDQEIKSAVLSTADVPLSNEDFVNKHEKILGKILSKVSVSDWIPAENRSTVENKIRQGVQKLYQDAQSSNNCNLEKAELTALEKSKTFLATYDERMDALVSRVAPPVQKTELASTHKKLEQEIGKTAKKTFANFPKYIVDRIWGKLQLDMNSRFEDYKEKLALKVKQNQTKMSQLVSDYVEMYLSEMDNLRSTVKNITDADLVRFHEHSKSKNMRHLTNILRLNENLDEGKVQKELDEKLEQVFSEIQQDASDLYKATNTKISELCNTAKVNYQKAIEKNRAQNEEELKKIHETVLSTVLDEFERSFTEIGDMQRFRQEKVALQADLQDLHGKSVNNFLDQHDKKSRQEINELLENYKKQVQSQLDQFYCVSDSKLRALHDHAFSELLSHFQQLVTIPSNLNSKTYDDLLIQKINEAFKLFESENIAKNKSLRKTIQNRVVQLSKELVAELNTMNYIDDTTLRKITTKYIQLYVESVTNEFSVDANLAAFCVSQMTEACTIAVDTWKPEAIGNRLVEICTSTYMLEMDGNLKNPLLTASHFQILHETASHNAIRRFKEDSKSQILPEFLTDKFEQALQKNIDQLSKNFKEEFDSTKPNLKGAAESGQNQSKFLFNHIPTSSKQLQPVPKPRTRQQQQKNDAESSPSSIPVGIFFSLDKISAATFDPQNGTFKTIYGPKLNQICFSEEILITGFPQSVPDNKVLKMRQILTNPKIDDNRKVEIYGRTAILRVEEIVAYILAQLHEVLKITLNSSSISYAITYPSSFNQTMWTALMHATLIAGIKATFIRESDAILAHAIHTGKLVDEKTWVLVAIEDHETKGSDLAVYENKGNGGALRLDQIIGCEPGSIFPGLLLLTGMEECMNKLSKKVAASSPRIYLYCNGPQSKARNIKSIKSATTDTQWVEAIKVSEPLEGASLVACIQYNATYRTQWEQKFPFANLSNILETLPNPSNLACSQVDHVGNKLQNVSINIEVRNNIAIHFKNLESVKYTMCENYFRIQDRIGKKEIEVLEDAVRKITNEELSAQQVHAKWNAALKKIHHNS